MDPIILTRIFSLIGFIIGLVSIIIVSGIIKRTKDAVRTGFIFVLISICAFVIFEAFVLLEVFLIVPQSNTADILAIVFVGFFLAGMWKLKMLIKELKRILK